MRRARVRVHHVQSVRRVGRRGRRHARLPRRRHRRRRRVVRRPRVEVRAAVALAVGEGATVRLPLRDGHRRRAAVALEARPVRRRRHGTLRIITRLHVTHHARILHPRRHRYAG